jgi:hypothetical protein
MRVIIKAGAIFVRHGANHDIYKNPRTGAIEEIPRHGEINEILAKNIIKNLSI